MKMIARIALSLFVVAALVCADPAGAAKRPDPTQIRIVSVVTHSEGLYILTTARGDTIMVSPAATTTPAPVIGAARKPSNLSLYQGKYRYTIAAIVYAEDQP